jgi:hypothetical protein
LKKLTLLFFSILLSTQVFAQAPVTPSEKTIQNHQNWFVYIGQYKLDPNWGIHVDVQFRMDEDIKFAKQNLLRTGLIRYLDSSSSVAAGYALINTHNSALNDYATEHRIWEQFIYNHKPARLNMSHRIRTEQRFVEKLSKNENGTVRSDGYSYGNRLRYLNRTTFDITRKPEARNIFYVALQDEIFLNIASPEVNKNFFDQNRFMVGIGIFNEKKTRLELGYLNQLTNPQSGPNIMNHILQVSVQQNLDFGARK